MKVSAKCILAVDFICFSTIANICSLQLKHELKDFLDMLKYSKHFDYISVISR